MPTGDILSSQISVNYVEEHSGSLGRGGFSSKIGARHPLFQASSSAGKIPRTQARHTSFCSGKAFGFVLTIDCPIKYNCSVSIS